MFSRLLRRRTDTSILYHNSSTMNKGKSTLQGSTLKSSSFRSSSFSQANDTVDEIRATEKVMPIVPEEDIFELDKFKTRGEKVEEGTNSTFEYTMIVN